MCRMRRSRKLNDPNDVRHLLVSAARSQTDFFSTKILMAKDLARGSTGMQYVGTKFAGPFMNDNQHLGF